jgi:formylglycine-generating enzyme required for sulfatase activity
MQARITIVSVVAMLLAAGTVRADVLNMGPGLTSLETVPVANIGNTGEWSGQSYGGYGPDRICGSVAYEYNIGKYEVTAGQYTAFLNAVADPEDTYGLYNTSMWSSSYGCKIQQSDSSSSYSVAADWANRPVNYVSWGDAARFANWLQNGQPTGAQGLTTTEDGAYYLNGATSDTALLAVSREADWKWAITSEDEWYKGAYHKNDGDTGNYFDYPTSSDSAPGQDMADVSGNNANYYTAPYAWPIDSDKYTTVVGEFQNSESPYGTFDQGGNIWEWNESILYGSCRGLRGGSFIGYGIDLHALARYDGYPTFEDDEVLGLGFRVSEVPEPASMAVLALGSIGMLFRRRGLKR